MTESTDYNYPTADEPTRDFSSRSSSNDSLLIETEKAGGGDVPKIIGDYEIRELIGAGGMGQVYLAEHRRMQRIVAIKMLPIERMADQSAVDKFYDEVRTASRLMHPNIVTAFDAGEEEGVHYLAMEYVDGETLTDIVAKNGPMSVGEAAAVIRQAALGLLHAHRAGIIHRDVKPGNLMRSVDGTVKVLDLGLAQISSAGLIREDGSSSKEEKKSRGRLTGTLPFMSPEQLEDADTIDARSDIYSLGATLYFLLTARPPYTGEFLDLIYGHRHGEIPDLMQARDDVDMRFANIFTRMMAKSPAERYASLDEVIDDLSEYASQTETPPWIAEFNQSKQAATEHTTVSSGSESGSTSTGTARVIAIDFGMFYGATAEASPTGGSRVLAAGGGDLNSFRMAISSDEQSHLLYGNEAMERRAEHAQNVVHCLPMYIGKPVVERLIAGRQCPPEVLMAMLMRRVRNNSWPTKPMPNATAITVPASYDQLHRRSILQAAQMAGLPSVRLVDRSVATVQSLLLDPEGVSLGDGMTSLEAEQSQTILFVGITGQASEVAVVRREASRLQQLSTGGHWHTGTLPWLHQLVDLTAKRFVVKHRIDPRSKSKLAAQLQMACERAMNSMLLLPAVKIKLNVRGEEKSVKVERRHWLQACEALVAGLRRAIGAACKDASITPADLDTCVTLGPLLRMNTIRDAVLRDQNQELQIRHMDRTDTARGAAACLAAELPGRGEIAKPPRGVTSQTIGIVVSDAKGRRRILPIIPKGTALPARTNRKLSVGTERDWMTLSLVESSGVERDDWHSLGRYDFDIGDAKVRSRMIGFELNVNGMLTVRAQTPGTSGSTKLPTLPKPMLTDEQVDQWTQWLNTLR